MNHNYGQKNAFNKVPTNYSLIQKEEKRKRGKMVVERILEENRKYRTKMGFFNDDVKP